MSHIIRELKVIKKQSDKTKEDRREFIKAVIVRHEGNIRVPGHPEKVWTSELGLSASLIPAINYTVQDVEGLPVILGWVTNPAQEERVIVSLDSGISTTINFGNFSTPEHSASHEWPTEATPGSDAIRIFQAAQMQLKTVINTTNLIVRVNPLYYISGLRPLYFPGQQLNLTAYLPSAGTTKYVMLYLNKNTNTIGVQSGAEVTTGLQPTKPNAPGVYAEPSSIIKLTAGQTALATTDYIEARNFLGADVSSALPATRLGEILYSTNGLDLTAELPLTNDNGIIVNDQGVILVV